MNSWLKFVIFSVIIGLVNGTHFIKVVILAGLGLTGLWLVHTIAQDFNGQNDSSSASRYIFKRSIEDNKKPVIDWEVVLSRDPANCLRSFVCQLSATKERLSKEEQQILNLVRYSAKLDGWAAEQLNVALKHGEKKIPPNQCMKIYKDCPFTSKMMLSVLRISDRVEKKL